MQGRAINFDSGATLRRPRLADRQTDVFVGTEFNGQWLIVSYDSANKKKHHKSIIHCVRSDVLFKTTNVGAPNNTDFIQWGAVAENLPVNLIVQQMNISIMGTENVWFNVLVQMHFIQRKQLSETNCPGEGVLVATKFNVTFLPLRLCYVNTSTCFSKDAENLTTYGYVLWSMQSDCLYSSLFFEHYNRILLCDWVIELCSVRLIDGVSSHNAFAFYLT